MGRGRNVFIEDQGTAGMPIPVGAPMEPAFRRIYKIDALKKEQDHRCAYCFEPLTIHTATADHVHPTHHGGMTSRKNIKAACQCCNVAKGHMPVNKFKRLIAHPPPDAPLEILLANMRRRIWLKEQRASKRILQFVGVQ